MCALTYLMLEWALECWASATSIWRVTHADHGSHECVCADLLIAYDTAEASVDIKASSVCVTSSTTEDTVRPDVCVALTVCTDCKLADVTSGP